MTRSLTAAAAALAVAATLGAVAVPDANAKSQTLHLYQVEGPTQFYNAAGKKIDLNPPAELPSAGDSFDETDLDYVGSYTSHAKQWTGSDHLACTFTSSDTGICNAQFAIGGSLLIFNNFKFNFKANSVVLKLSEGTGSFAGAHGTMSIIDLPNGNSNLVARVS